MSGPNTNGGCYLISVPVPASEAESTRSQIKDAVSEFFSDNQPISIAHVEDHGTFPIDVDLATVIVSFVVSLASNEAHSPRWVPAFKSYLRSRFGGAVEFQEKEP
jgi:hypothetical protein